MVNGRKAIWTVGGSMSGYKEPDWQGRTLRSQLMGKFIGDERSHTVAEESIRLCQVGGEHAM